MYGDGLTIKLDNVAVKAALLHDIDLLQMQKEVSDLWRIL